MSITATPKPITLQSTSFDIWKSKYQLTTKEGVVIDHSIAESFSRISKALSAMEPDNQQAWEDKFLWALEHGAIPAGRIMANAGALAHKPATSTINCTVSGTIHDSMDDILKKVHRAGLTLKAGCGIGYEFSTLRPKNAYVAGAGAQTSGPLSFMDIFDKMCFTISSAGGRRGAQMATFDIGHPDVVDFIKAKREDGRFRQFNLSLLITDAFIEAVKAKQEWPLAFPIRQANQDKHPVNLDDPKKVLWREWPITEGYVQNDVGLVACEITNSIRADRLWDIIMTSNYDFAEPGFILIDRVNKFNNNWFCENIRACNPCGEQNLPPDAACLLGSINLTHFITESFTDNASFDWNTFKKVVHLFTRMLDNVVEINGLPLIEQQEEIKRKRRHGMGYLGLGSAMTMLKMKYGDKDSLSFVNDVTQMLAVEGWREGVRLAKEKGAAPIMDEVFDITGSMLRLRPQLKKDGYEIGDKVAGRILLAKYSHYMKNIAKVDRQLVDDIAQYGSRFTHHTSIAPTGTIALSIGNNASNGIEPSFSHQYCRNVIVSGKKSKQKVDVFSYELLAYRALIDNSATTESLPDYFIASSDVLPSQHVDVQAAAQPWIDSSISKTANIPTDFPFEDFKGIYIYAHDQGLKGCTTFRFNPEVFQGVLVKEGDLKATTYAFSLEDGTTVELKGDEEVEYEGETHTAANLFDALKEGYFGKL